MFLSLHAEIVWGMHAQSAQQIYPSPSWMAVLRKRSVRNCAAASGCACQICEEPVRLKPLLKSTAFCRARARVRAFALFLLQLRTVRALTSMFKSHGTFTETCGVLHSQAAFRHG